MIFCNKVIKDEREKWKFIKKNFGIFCGDNLVGIWDVYGLDSKCFGCNIACNQ